MTAGQMTDAVSTSSRSRRGAWILRGQALAGLILTGVILLVALCGPTLAPHKTDEFIAPPFTPPSGAAPLGTDYLGQDVLSRAMAGGFTVVWMSVAAATLGVIIGAVVGMVAGYGRRATDEWLMRGADVALAFPQMVFVLLFVTLIGREPWMLVLIAAITWAPHVARVTRGVTVDIVNREYVQAVELIGLPRWKILLGEVLPGLSGPLLVEYGTRLTWSIGLISALSFLGFGIQAPQADWGLMINENRLGLLTQPWAVVVPIVLIATFAIGTNLLTEGLSRHLSGIGRR